MINGGTGHASSDTVTFGNYLRNPWKAEVHQILLSMLYLFQLVMLFMLKTEFTEKY